MCYSLSKVEGLTFFLKIGIELCPWSSVTRKFPRIVKFALEVYLQYPDIFFFFFPAEFCL